MLNKTFLVSGMHCNSCAQIVEMDLEELPGIKSAKLDYASSKAIVEFDESKVNVHKIIETINKAGYSAKAEK